MTTIVFDLSREIAGTPAIRPFLYPLERSGSIKSVQPDPETSG